MRQTDVVVMKGSDLKRYIERDFNKALESKDLDAMNEACIRMAKVNDGDSYRLWNKMQRFKRQNKQDPQR